MEALTVTYVFREGTQSQAEAHLRALVGASRAEPGCRGYDVYRSRERARTYLIVERYDDGDALEAHRQTPHFREHGLDGIRVLAESRTPEAFEPLETA